VMNDSRSWNDFAFFLQVSVYFVCISHLSVLYILIPSVVLFLDHFGFIRSPSFCLKTRDQSFTRISQTALPDVHIAAQSFMKS